MRWCDPNTQNIRQNFFFLWVSLSVPKIRWRVQRSAQAHNDGSATVLQHWNERTRGYSIGEHTSFVLEAISAPHVYDKTIIYWQWCKINKYKIRTSTQVNANKIRGSNGVYVSINSALVQMNTTRVKMYDSIRSVERQKCSLGDTYPVR